MMNPSQLATEILSGATISMLMVPEAFAFSGLLGLDAESGMNSTMVMSFLTSLFGGQPGLISGATGSTATSLMGMSKKMGSEYVVVAVIIAGIVQLLIGGAGLTKYLDKIPAPVLSGFLVALALLIFRGQIDYLKDKDGKWLGDKSLLWTIGLIVVGFATARISGNFQDKIPGALIGAGAVFLLAHIFKAPVLKIGDLGDIKAGLPKFNIPKVELNKETFLKVLPWAIGMAVIGLIESQIMLKEANKILPVAGNPTRETFAQGLANLVTGFTNGMGGCVLVGQSKLNYAQGGRTRLSSMATSLSFGALVIFLSKYIKKFPLPALMAIMMDIVVRTGDWSSLAGGMNTSTLTTLFTVMTALLSQNLALGVGAGSALHYLV